MHPRRGSACVRGNVAPSHTHVIKYMPYIVNPNVADIIDLNLNVLLICACAAP